VNERGGRWYARWWAILIILGLVLGATAFVTTKALGLRSVVVDAQPFPQPPEGFDTEWWNGALMRWVEEDRVDYNRVLDDAQDLRRFAATLAVLGPSTTPERFQTEAERLAYYINAYNALTLLGVVDNWPISSVHDVRGWLNPRAGFGFFYGLRFSLDGGEINLYDLENGVIRGFRDARIHAAINCASNSCPPLAPYAYDPAELDEQLDRVTRAFCSSPLHVGIDDETGEIRLSSIFDWYRADFEEHARRLGRSPTVEDFILAFAESSVADALERAREAGFELVFQPYDWGLNEL
jgi:hypothetical protein